MIELLAQNTVATLASDATNNFGDTRSGGLAGPTGFVIILLLVIGTVLLIRNMNSRLRRLPRSFDRPPAADDRSAPEPGVTRNDTQDGSTPV
jgi:hypothetical protein